MNKPKILFFTPTPFPNATEKDIVASRFFDADVQYVSPGRAAGDVIPCDGVLGIVPDKYAAKPDAYNVVGEYRVALAAAPKTAADVFDTPSPAPVAASAATPAVAPVQPATTAKG